MLRDGGFSYFLRIKINILSNLSCNILLVLLLKLILQKTFNLHYPHIESQLTKSFFDRPIDKTGAYLDPVRVRKGFKLIKETKGKLCVFIEVESCAEIGLYDGPRNLDSVLSYTWEQKGGGPSGEFKEEAHTVI